MRSGSRTLLAALALIASVAIAGAAWAQASAAFVATVTQDGTDLHRGAGGTTPRAGRVSKGAKLPAFGLSPDKQWVKVKSGSETAWIARSAVTIAKAGQESASSEPSSTPAPTSTQSRTSSAPPPPRRFGTVTAERAKVLSNPTSSAPLVMSAKAGEVFAVDGVNGEYVKVHSRDGKIGWIARSDIKPGRIKVEPKHDDFASTDDNGFSKTDDSGFSKTDDGGFSHSSGGSRGRSPDDDEPATPRHHVMADENATQIWFQGGLVLIHERVTSLEGYGYDFSGKGYGAGVRIAKPIGDGGLWIEGGYFGTANQRVAAPPANGASEGGATVFSMLHQFDFDAAYRHSFNGEEGLSLAGFAGFQNYTFYFQPQTASWFYSQLYDGLEFGARADYGLMGGTLKPWLELRYLGPTFAVERYGSGGAGGDGQSNSTSGGIGIGLGVWKEFSSGSKLGVSYRSAGYTQKWSGQGSRGLYTTHSNKVVDGFQTITISFARGF